MAMWQKTLFIRQEVQPERRGWLVDVMACISKIGEKKFSLRELYMFESALQTSYPQNLNIRAKIRQQLQKLRDGGFIEFLGDGNYIQK